MENDNTQNSQIQLSLIIPIYNVENYLEACLESVLQQKVSGLECLLLNNGSTDGSTKIAEEYSSKYPELFQLYNLEIKGVSNARNFGIKNAKGDYIGFLDSDDMLVGDFLAEMLLMAYELDLDMVIGNFSHLYPDNQTKINKNIIVTSDVCSGQDWLLKSLKKRKFMPAVWNKLYRRVFLIEQEIFFDTDLVSAEDFLFMVLVLNKAKKVAVFNKPFYLYRLRHDSISKTNNIDQLRSKVCSHLAVTEKLIDLRNAIPNELFHLIMEKTIRLNQVSCLSFLKENHNKSDLIEKELNRLNQLSLYRFVRFKRLSHFMDWLTLRLSFSYYLKWRAKK